MMLCLRIIVLLTLHTLLNALVAGEVRCLCSGNLDSRHQLFSGAGNIKPSARGVSHFQSFYFVIVLLSLLLLCVVSFLYQKFKKISYLHLVYFQFIIMSSCLLAINGNKILFSKWIHGGTTK